MLRVWRVGSPGARGHGAARWSKHTQAIRQKTSKHPTASALAVVGVSYHRGGDGCQQSQQAPSSGRAYSLASCRFQTPEIRQLWMKASENTRRWPSTARPGFIGIRVGCAAYGRMGWMADLGWLPRLRCSSSPPLARGRHGCIRGMQLQRAASVHCSWLSRAICHLRS